MSKRPLTKRQLEAAQRRYYNCKNCKWSEISINWCMRFDMPFDSIFECGDFEAKNGVRDCTKCIHYNKRKNAAMRCKIGILNCKGVINEDSRRRN